MGLNMRYELSSESTTNLLRSLFQDDEHNCLLLQAQTLLLEDSATHDEKESQLIPG
jgi:hypothetical protein